MSGSEMKVIDKKKDVIEIPIGKLFKNPWFFVSLVLAVVLIVVFATGSSMGGGTVSSEKAGQNIIDFINSQGQGTAAVVEAEREGSLHRIVLSYQGQQVPVYATLDGEFLVSSAIPLDGSVTAPPSDNGGNTGGTNTVRVSVDDDAVLGKKDAPITIVEFSDYQCPFCGSFWSQTLPQIKSEYIDTGKVNLVYRDFPLDNIHPMATPAAIAAECVKEQGGDEAYFEYHDKIFGNQQSLSDASLKSWAKDLGYNIDNCLDSQKYLGEVQKDLADAQAAGGNGTPFFVIIVNSNGEGTPLSGALPFAQFKQVLDGLGA